MTIRYFAMYQDVQNTVERGGSLTPLKLPLWQEQFWIIRPPRFWIPVYSQDVHLYHHSSTDVDAFYYSVLMANTTQKPENFKGIFT